MKTHKKAFLLIMSILLILSSLCFTLSAKENAAPISPALAVIASKIQMKKCGITNSQMSFSKSDFEDFFNVESVDSITISSLPSEFEGKLCLKDIPVIANQTIYRSDISDLTFTPASNSINTASFRFFGNNASVESSVLCNMYFLPEINTAPTIIRDTMGGQRVTTQKNIMVYSTLSAEDAENDSLCFEVKTEAQHGIVCITDKENGNFTYTPASDYYGKDSFEYVVYDQYGNRSDSAWINIEIEKNENNTFFSDMLRHTGHNSAVKASSYNIMSGKLIDGELCFLPNSTITKAEFVTMALKASGNSGKIFVAESGFDDDSDIPTNLKSYVAYAANTGIISGTKTEQGIFFYPNSPITRAEAAVIVSKIINANEYTEKTVFNDISDIPSWAESEIMTLAEMKIMTDVDEGNFLPNDNITNIQAAEMLCKVYELK
ncbi:MAG: S-layer homology domain-containing protein [Clostridia bacterium]|nr:S-layer homology domain-containing protein [Clostridia bacterium]